MGSDRVTLTREGRCSQVSKAHSRPGCPSHEDKWVVVVIATAADLHYITSDSIASTDQAGSLDGKGETSNGSHLRSVLDAQMPLFSHVDPPRQTTLLSQAQLSVTFVLPPE